MRSRLSRISHEPRGRFGWLWWALPLFLLFMAFGYPLLRVGEPTPCGAVAMLFGRAVASGPAERMTVKIAGPALVVALSQKCHPDMPPQLNCALRYWLVDWRLAGIGPNP